MKASKPQIVELSAQVVEAHQSYEKALASKDGTEQRYLDNLCNCIYHLKWVIERDNSPLIKRFKESQ